MAEQPPSPSRPLLRRMLSFREPLLLIPFLLVFLGSSLKRLSHKYVSSFHSSGRPLGVPGRSASTHAAVEGSGVEGHGDVSGEGEEAEALSMGEVGEILERLGLGRPQSLQEGACMGHAEFARMFEAEEPSFEEAKQAFAVFDHDGDGFVDAADLQRALAKLGLREDLNSCRLMISASAKSGKEDSGRMSFFQFVRFLEDGF